MKYFAPLILVGFLSLGAWLGTAGLGLYTTFGVVIPYLALAVFLLGFTFRVISWARAPVPYRIPTTAGQARTLDWIKYDKYESPATLKDVLGRMGLEVFLFRSLFRNNRAVLREGPQLNYLSSKGLWLGSMVFHYALLVIVLRHYRFFLEPVPGFVALIDAVDGFVQITLPTFYMTDLLIGAALAYLLLRRFVDAPIRYLSLPQDYFPLYLIGGIALTGVLMRYSLKTDVIQAKALVQSLIAFQPHAQPGLSGLFHTHLFLVCVLAAYFPFSKLMHMGGIFFSPTRNLANNNREKRHINPHNPEIALGSYGAYEEEFREKMIQSGIPLDDATPAKPH